MGWAAGVLFMSPSGWYRQHVTGHHVHTNVHTKDPDLYHFDGMLDLHPDAPCSLRVPWKHPVLRPLLVMLTSFHPLLVGTSRLLMADKWPFVVSVTPWADGEKLRTWLGWGATLLLVLWQIAIRGFLYTMVPFFVVGTCYYAFSQVSHINAVRFCAGHSDAIL
eukprot:SAG22_NODE_2257_length_2780_cov_2.690041_2_plen_163_part_00